MSPSELLSKIDWQGMQEKGLLESRFIGRKHIFRIPLRVIEAVEVGDRVFYWGVLPKGDIA